MPRILLVDNEASCLEQTALSLRERLTDWEIATSTTGEGAFQLIQDGEFDVMLTDLDLGGDNEGEQLLRSVVERFPSVSRIVLSGNSQRAVLLRSMGRAHQVIEKPCSIEDTANTVLRVYSLRKHLNSDALLKVVNRIDKLPTLPEKYVQLGRILERDDYNQQSVVQLINQDITISAQLLRVANSSFYGRRFPVRGVEQALNLLGTTTVKMLVLSSELFARCSKSTIKEFGLEELWRHSLSVGKYAQMMAKKAVLSGEVTDEAFSAGLLHDLGKLVLIQTMKDDYRKALALRSSEGLVLEEAEEEIFGVSHADVGGYLLGVWGMPDSIVEAAVYHHHPMACVCRDISVLGLVCAANAVDHAKHDTEELALSTSEYEQYLHDSGSDEILAAWHDIADTSEEQ